MRIIAILFFVLLSGCSQFENEQIVPDEISGEWDWYLTAGGWGHHPIAADTAGYDMTLHILRPNIANWFKNDSLMNEYRLERGDEDWIDWELVMYRIDNSNQVNCGFKLNHTEDDELHLSSANCTDLPIYYFRRNSME